MLLGETASAGEPVAAAHERFIDELIDRHAVLLGGPFNAPVAGASAAYVLPARSHEEALALAHSDPLVSHGGVECQVVEWQLVGIDPAAIEPALAVGRGRAKLDNPSPRARP